MYWIEDKLLDDRSKMINEWDFLHYNNYWMEYWALQNTGFTQGWNEPSTQWNARKRFKSSELKMKSLLPRSCPLSSWVIQHKNEKNGWNLLCFFFTGSGGGSSLLSPKKSARRGSIKLWCLLCMALNIMLLKLLCLKVSMCTLCGGPLNINRKIDLNHVNDKPEKKIKIKINRWTKIINCCWTGKISLTSENCRSLRRCRTRKCVDRVWCFAAVSLLEVPVVHRRFRRQHHHQLRCLRRTHCRASSNWMSLFVRNYSCTMTWSM